jgi:hypothetical protein
MASDRVEAIVDVLATGVARLAKWVLYAFLGMMALVNVQNRFVSYKTLLKPGQTLRIRRAIGRFLSTKHYQVSVPGAELAEGVPILIHMDSNGHPEPLVYEPTGK